MLEYEPVPECDACGATNAALSDYYVGAPGGPHEPLLLCDGCTQDRAEWAWEAHLRDFYGGDSPTEAMVMEEARRLK